MDDKIGPIITNILESFDYAIRYSIKNNILPNRCEILQCPNCHHQMSFYQSTKHWKCHNFNCQTTRSQLYPLKVSKNNFQNYLSSLILFSADIPVYEVLKLYNISDQVLYRNYAQFRNTIYKKYIMEMQSKPLSFHVQIDESLFSKRKYERGRKKPQTWVFGACDDQCGGRVYMVLVPKRDEDTLLPIIQSWCPEGSIINSDCWAAYRNIPNFGYAHCTVNHSENFVDPDTNEHTQRIEGLWHQAKLFLQSHCYNKSSEIEHYIAEWCFRYNHHKNMMEILKEILYK